MSTNNTLKNTKQDSSPKDKAKMKGEGDHEADRRYRENAQEFVKQGRVEESADEASKQGKAESESAEKAGKSRAKELDPEVHREYEKPTGKEGK